MNNYNIAFAEVYEVLNILNRKEYEKIPQQIICFISENRDKNYKYSINEKENLVNQKMLQETKAILYNFYRDYWATEEEKNKIIEKQRLERWKNEEEKRNAYNDIFKTNIPESPTDVELVVYKKENIFRRIIRFLKYFK